MNVLPRVARLVLVTVALGGCATVGAPGSRPGGTPGGGAQRVVATSRWPVRTYEHVDLWLHGYAMLTRDTAAVPFFDPDYRTALQHRKLERHVVTMLDANREQLAARLASNPSLVNGQFVPLYFTSFDQMQQVISLFLHTGSDRGSVDEPNLQGQLGMLAASFPSAADRDWLRLFTQSIADERTRFFHEFWIGEQAMRAPARGVVDSLWQQIYQPRFRRYLENTQQARGEFILSLPLDGEGRTISGAGQQAVVTTNFPRTPATAVDAIYVFAHEIVNAVTAPAIADNISPAQERSGIAGSYATNASVRGGALLLQRVAPTLVPGYMHYYLGARGSAVPAVNVASAFAARFPLPDVIRDAIIRQIDTVLGGI